MLRRERSSELVVVQPVCYVPGTHPCARRRRRHLAGSLVPPVGTAAAAAAAATNATNAAAGAAAAAAELAAAHQRAAARARLGGPHRARARLAQGGWVVPPAIHLDATHHRHALCIEHLPLGEVRLILLGDLLHHLVELRRVVAVRDVRHLMQHDLHAVFERVQLV